MIETNKKEVGNSNAFRIRIKYRIVCKFKFDNGNILATAPSAGASLRSMGAYSDTNHSKNRVEKGNQLTTGYHE